ncbi:MAG TPA: hypothetical protein PKD09_13150 [Aggregatilinea sp.]|uniref:hypothetical protein n=1 Tax=Aggregatilinea sp. TaxID=2806333 RepID=UPI002BD6BE4C|nr:hypothetical protein [Aggregatilinea sp.]HML22594.1 hypothetical protein [Aggregatilinea sp.]
MPLDLAAALSKGINGLEDALLASFPLADFGAPTLVMRQGDSTYVGQFRHRMGDQVAQLTLVAPEPQEGDSPIWTRLLEALAFEAGKRGAHLLSAEIDEGHAAFPSFRMAGFAVYSRQVILRREPASVQRGQPDMLRPACSQDAIGISVLWANTVPRLLQQAEPLPDPDYSGGLVYERDGQIAAYLSVTDGKSGIVIKPYFHPEIYEQTSDIILAALARTSHAEDLPVYLYARAYQDWLQRVLEEVEFVPWTHQALMVKYTTVRAERAEVAALHPLEASRLRPPVANGPLPLHKLSTHNGRAPANERSGGGFNQK